MEQKKSITTPECTPTSRRHFLGVLAASGAGMLLPPPLFAQEKDNQKPVSIDSPLVDSPPVLQCPAETSITIVWAVSQSAAGFVEFGTEKDKLDQTAHGDIFGLKPYHERFLQVRIEGLKPNIRYFYRTVTRSFKYINAYQFEQGEPVYSDVFSFETTGKKKAKASFSVINDTHNNQGTLKLLGEKLLQLGSEYTVWNGDLVNSFDSADMAVESILRPGGIAWATEKPLLFVPGNHDYRGAWARNIPLLLPPWKHESPQDQKFGRNFVVRSGPLALIGLDTGEDKPDFRSEWAGLSRFEPYRTAQRDWLERALKSPEVATAPFVVVFCHIPLYTSNPNANGGDSTEGFAYFQRQAANLWGPLLTKYKVQALITAHQHHFNYYPASPERTWAQITGGGHMPKDGITVIHGKAEDNYMEISVDELITGTELGHWTFPKRRLQK
jgi:hypothetical protein